MLLEFQKLKIPTFSENPESGITTLKSSRKRNSICQSQIKRKNLDYICDLPFAFQNLTHFCKTSEINVAAKTFEEAIAEFEKSMQTFESCKIK